MIRNLDISDIVNISRINSENFAHPWSDKQLRAELQKKNSIQLVNVENSVVLAFLIASHIYEDIEIITLAVDKSQQRKGIASLLLAELFERSASESRVFLEVSKLNKTAISFYQSHDFKEISQRKTYYRDGSDAIIMSRII